MCIFLSLLCSLSCVLLVLDTTRDLAFRDRTSDCCRGIFQQVVSRAAVIVVIEVRVLDRGFEFVRGFEIWVSNRFLVAIEKGF